MSDRAPNRLGVLAAVLMVCIAGCGTARDAVPRGSSTSSAPSEWRAVPGQVAAVPDSEPGEDHADPVELRIPSIGVHSRLERLSTDARGELESPRDPARAGWFAGGVQPGDAGPAVIAGHVDSRTGPAVFTRLASLRPGAEVVVTDTAGRVVTFRVDLVKSYPKAEFPTRDVYGATPDPQVRLITCGGDFDRAGGHYIDNVIVYAGLAN